MLFIATLLFVICSVVDAEPPHYKSFKREQLPDYSPNEDSLLRIWVVYVGQGDGILIQLPTRYNYDPDPEDDDPDASERVEILIDGGSNPLSDANLMGEFTERLLGWDSPLIEHTVITHNDRDHIAGLTRMLRSDDFRFERIYHGGLASYKAGYLDFPYAGKPDGDAVYEFENGAVHRGMAFCEGGRRIVSEYLVGDLDSLISIQEAGMFQGDYGDLAEAAVTAHRDNRLAGFDRVFAGKDFIVEHEESRGTDMSDMQIDLLWPLETLYAYPLDTGNTADWGKTANGNSVSFRLIYGDFEMLFTGDLYEDSQKHLLDHLTEQDSLVRLQCDVLKAPHHGSSHYYKNFMKREVLEQVVTVASMGFHGFDSKALDGGWNYRHPYDSLVTALGGAHKFYSTFIHEKKFWWRNMTEGSDRQEMIEDSLRTILIETDGEWFRLVEVSSEHTDLENPPDVYEVRRSNGTRWIRAKGE